MSQAAPLVSMRTIIPLYFFLVICILFFRFLDVIIQFTRKIQVDSA